MPVAAFRRLATECGSCHILSYYSRIEVRCIPGFHDRAAPVFEVAEVVEKKRQMRFYEELNDFFAARATQGLFHSRIPAAGFHQDMIEALGVPAYGNRSDSGQRPIRGF